MKIPLRFQITEYDCGTVSLLNAFSYLYEREDIPAPLIKAIFKYTLDCYDEDGNLGQGGTSKEAVSKLMHWITKFSKANSFSVKCEHLEKGAVTLSKIVDCLNNNGCVFVRSFLENDDHYILVTKLKSNKVYIFDPYYLDKAKYIRSKNVRIVLNKPFSHNRVVSLKRFFSETTDDFSLGPVFNRECVLINRI